MKLFTQNTKMKKSSSIDQATYNFGIPAFQSSTGLKTCPNAGICAAGCYAKSGAYVWSNVKQAFEKRLDLTQSKLFIPMIQTELNKLKRKHVNLIIRIHDSGDFYNSEYYTKWDTIMKRNPDVRFYAYTKEVAFFKDVTKTVGLPKNFTVIYSLGGKQDALINQAIDRHSKVFETIDELLKQGYVDTSNDDTHAWQNSCNKIGLVYHGTKSYKNTKWAKVFKKVADKNNILHNVINKD